MMDVHTSPSLRNPKRRREEDLVLDSVYNDILDSPPPDSDYGSINPNFDPFAPPFPSPKAGLRDQSPDTPTPSASKRPQVTMEEVEDVDAPGRSSKFNLDASESDDVELEFVEDFEGEAGTPGKMKRTPFEKIRDEQKKAGEHVLGKFADADEWGMAQWLMTAGVSQNRREAFLKLPIVRTFTADLSTTDSSMIFERYGSV